MNLLDATALLRSQAPERSLAGAGWPCTEFLALVLLTAAERPADDPYARGSDWWRDMNVWDATRPFSLPRAAADLAEHVTESGADFFVDRVVPNDQQRWWFEFRDLCTPMRWYVAQGARRLQPDGTADRDDAGWGHAFAFAIAPNGHAGCVLECSIARGLRFNGQPWKGAPERAPTDLRHYLGQFKAGVNFTPLWAAAAELAGSVEVAVDTARIGTPSPPPAVVSTLPPPPVHTTSMEGQMAKKKIRIPFDEIAALAGALLASGSDPSEIPGIVGKFLDDAVDFDEIVPGLAGDALEAIDGPVSKAATMLILRVVKPEALMARAAAL